MKRHGIWQFHRAINSRGDPLKWWTPEEIEQASRRYSLVSGNFFGDGQFHGPYRRMDVVIRCANRYMRLYKLPRTVGKWNEVCRLIGKRMNAYTNTMKAVIHYESRVKAPVYGDSEFEVPQPARSLHQVRQRLERIKDAQRDRLNAIYQQQQKEIEHLQRFCFICQKNDAHPSRYFWRNHWKLLGLEEALSARPHPHVKCCTPCHLRLSKLLVKAKEADEARLSIQRFRRKQNETTKNNARTA